MNFSDKSLHLTYDEFYVLMCLLGAKSVQGTFVENHYDISPDDFEKMWDCCRKSLLSKGYITLDGEDSKLDIGLHYIITECVNAEKKYGVQLSKDKTGIIDTVFYERKKSMIRVDNFGEKNEVYLSYCSKKKAFDNVVKEIFDAERNMLEEMPIEITLSQQEYFILMSSVNMCDYTKAQQLFSNEIPEAYKMDLINALKESCGLLSISEFEDEGISNYSILFGKSCFWAMYVQDEETISFKLVSGKDLKESLAQTFGYDGGRL